MMTFWVLAIIWIVLATIAIVLTLLHGETLAQWLRAAHARLTGNGQDSN